jgi:frataxin-like iron-binding protein CyaY
MATVKRRYSKSEFARRGAALFKKLRANLSAEDEEKFIAIDIETGEYEIHANEMTAAARLRKRIPGAQIWLVGIGTGFLDRFGGHALRGEA